MTKKTITDDAPSRPSTETKTDEGDTSTPLTEAEGVDSNHAQEMPSTHSHEDEDDDNAPTTTVLCVSAMSTTGTSTSSSSSTPYKPFFPYQVKDELLKLQVRMAEREAAWQFECDTYHNNTQSQSSRKCKSPKRSKNKKDNKSKKSPNEEEGESSVSSSSNTINTKLYPYHSDFSVLEQQVEEEQHQFERTGCLLPCRTTDLTALFVPLCSFIDPQSQSSNKSATASPSCGGCVVDDWWCDLDPWTFDLLDADGDLTFDEENVGRLLIDDFTSANLFHNNKDTAGVAEDANQEVTGKAKSEAMLNLIRHATSYLQRDFRLAAAVVLGIASQQYCRDVEYLRTLIAVVSTSPTDGFPSHCRYGNCSEEFLEEQADPEEGWHFRAEGEAIGVIVNNAVAQDAGENDDDEDDDDAEFEDTEEDDNEESPTPLYLNHSCHDVHTLYTKTIDLCITHGIPVITKDHATLLAAWVVHELEVLCSTDTEEAIFIHNPQAFSSKTTQQHYYEKSLLLGNGNGKEDKKNNTEDYQKAMLKHHMNQRREYVPLEFKSLLIEKVVVGLGKHAALDRMRYQHLAASLSDETLSKDKDKDVHDNDVLLQLQQYYESWTNSVCALVAIGESLLRRLPPTLDLSDELAGYMIQAFMYAFLAHPSSIDDDEEEANEDGDGEMIVVEEVMCDNMVQLDVNVNNNHKKLPIQNKIEGHDDDSKASSSGDSSSSSSMPHLTLQEQYQQACLDKGSVLCPTRYADAIDHATEWNQTHIKQFECSYEYDDVDTVDVNVTATGTSTSEGGDSKKTSTAKVTVSFAPPDDVQRLVRALFVRQDVDMECTGGLGYGTWLVLCHLPISPLDPMVIRLDANVIPPEDDDDDSDSDDDSDDDDSDDDSEDNVAAYYDEVRTVLYFE
jgi:hypothetical protein